MPFATTAGTWDAGGDMKDRGIRTAEARQAGNGRMPCAPTMKWRKDVVIARLRGLEGLEAGCAPPVGAWRCEGLSGDGSAERASAMSDPVIDYLESDADGFVLRHAEGFGARRDALRMMGRVAHDETHHT